MAEASSAAAIATSSTRPNGEAKEHVIVRVSAEECEHEAGERCAVKVICLGDSAVGKSKLVERFLADDFKPQQQSTYALTLYKYETKIRGKKVIAEFWDTAGQEQFNHIHPSFYHQAHACILVFDVTRKITYKNLQHWYDEMRHHRPDVPCILVANKIDADYKVTQKNFKFAEKNYLPFYFVSAADGTNVVKVFREALKAAVAYKEKSTDFLDEVMQELKRMDDLSSVQPVTTPSSSSQHTPASLRTAAGGMKQSYSDTPI